MTGATVVLGALVPLLLVGVLGLSPVAAVRPMSFVVDDALVTPTPPVPDRLVPVPEPEPQEQTVPTGRVPTEAPARTAETPRPPGPAPTASAGPREGAGAGGTGRTDADPAVPALDVALLVLSLVATVLALVSLHERLAPPRASRARTPPPAAGGWSPAPRLLAAEGTVRPADLQVPAVPRDGVAVLPVLARPERAPVGWMELHDVVDAWAWHEYWLPTGRAAGAVLPADGLVLGDAVALPDGLSGGDLVAPVPEADPAVLPVSAGVILSRPAAADSGQLGRRLVREARALRAAAHQRAGAAVALAHSLTGPVSAVALPVAAVVGGAPVAVLAATLAPVGVGLVSTALRWAALDDADRATTLRLPVGRGWLLVVTGPAHAVLRCRAAWVALRAAPPVPLARRVALAPGRPGRPGRPGAGPRPVAWGSERRA